MYMRQAYRELHGVLGEGKGRFFPTMPILMCLLNTEPANELPIMERLRVRVMCARVRPRRAQH